MIVIKIDFYKNGFTCHGHANSAKYNHDLVCAGVSAIIFGALNWFDKEQCEIEVGENFIKVKEKNNKIDFLLNLLKIQINALMHDKYLQYIELNEHNYLLN
ncbi:MAG: ribosomal-processing cysteine protease Prp [Ureaplasma sp.]|nr:ribosomal-processing cysteine protease Prp [Ureaplasma sp.]